MIFGGDGIFLAALAGPGRVWLQSPPISKLAHAPIEYLPGGREQRTEAGVVDPGRDEVARGLIRPVGRPLYAGRWNLDVHRSPRQPRNATCRYLEAHRC
jgi:hypothetical protein